METYSEADFRAVGVEARFVQDNQSLSAQAGTLRGMHFQLRPRAQAKLVRVLQGSILDIVVDLRRASPGFGRHATCRLAAPRPVGDAAGGGAGGTGEGAEGAGDQFFVPEGFAHGFVTLEPDTVVAYKVSDAYAPECDRGLAWDDPDLALPWPDLAALGLPDGPVLSDKDRRHPRLRDLPDAF